MTTAHIPSITVRIEASRAEVTGALTRNLDLSKGQLQAQAGGNYLLREGLTLNVFMHPQGVTHVCKFSHPVSAAALTYYLSTK